MKNAGEVYKISFSAFFADLGYQAAVALFPLILVVIFGVPVSFYGIIEGINYGGATFMGFLGGLAADKYGAKRVTVIGNAFITFIALIGLAANYLEAAIFFMAGWFARNFRSPPRRVMILLVTEPSERRKAFSVLHALDIGGASLALVYVTLGLYARVDVALLTIPALLTLLISTALLASVRVGWRENVADKGERREGGGKVLWGVVVSTMLFAFSQYSFGFPIITSYEVSHELYLASLTYLVFLSSSSLFGYLLGKTRFSDLKGLAFLGYALGGTASLGYALTSHLGLAYIWGFSVILGLSVAATEVFEPTIVARVAKREGAGMGLLSLGRSLGIFLTNTVMGLLYQINYAYSYAFAASASFVAALIA
ncbi:MAG: MFS transporter, partial [Sulfolobaceae archaeon]|nr:MFS transporter [Sulfolobales archaeon]